MFADRFGQEIWRSPRGRAPHGAAHVDAVLRPLEREEVAANDKRLAGFGRDARNRCLSLTPVARSSA